MDCYAEREGESGGDGMSAEAMAMRNAGLLAEYDGGTKAAIEAQCTAGVNILRRVQEAVA